MKRIGTKVEPQATLRTTAPVDRRELLLYVEDDESNWHVAELRLSQGYQLLRAATAEEACRALQQRGSELSAILMDIELRGSELNGMELTKLIRGRRAELQVPPYAKEVPTLPHTPIIFVTAHGAKYSDAHLMLAGGNKVISKPVDFGALSIALTQLHLARAARSKKR